MDAKFHYIQEIALAQSHVVVHKSLMVGQMNMSLNQHNAETGDKIWKILEKLDEKLSAITFENERDISQTFSLIQQQLDERFNEPCKHGTTKAPGSPTDSGKFVMIFVCKC